MQKVELEIQEFWMHTKTVVDKNKKKYNRKEKHKNKFNYEKD